MNKAKMKFATILAVLSEVSVAWSHPGARRSLRNVLTNSACPNIRLSFPVRVDAIYLYTVIPRDKADFNVKTVEQTIASAVSSLLEICDNDGRPTHVVELPDEGKHEVVDYEYRGDLCHGGNTCILVRGTTSILTSSATDSAMIESETSDLIELAFDDLRFLTQASNSSDVSLALILGVDLLLPAIGSDVLDTDTEGQSQTIRTVAIAVGASVTFTSVVLYLLYTRGEFGADGHRKNKLFYLQAKRKRFFQDLDDENSLPMGWMVTNGTTSPPSSLPKEGTVTWSVSDLTSDAESIRSNLPLERIVEVDDEMSSDEGGAFRDRSYAASSPIYSPRSPVKISGLEFVANWKEKPKSPRTPRESVEVFEYKGRKTVLWKQDNDEEISNGTAQTTEDVEGAIVATRLESSDDQELGIIIPAQSDDDTKFHTPTAIETAPNDQSESDFGSPAALSEDGESSDSKTPKSTDRNEPDAGVQSPLLLWAQAAVQKLVGDK